jgi:putative tryptophan/tyrosine transport system permease protein
MSEFYLTAFQLSLCLSPMVMGIFISMKVFNIPDITTDGSYTLGAVVTAILLTQHYPVYVVMLLGMLSGAAAGMVTALIHTKLKIDALLAGILVMTGLYSINLIILGRSNVPIIDVPTLFSSQISTGLIILIVITATLFLIVKYFLKTDFGIAMRASGNNPTMAKANGINNSNIKIIGLAIANSLTALSGFLVAQYQSFSDINMGVGIVITGLGSVLIADTLKTWMNIRNIGSQILLLIIGSLLFQLVLALTLVLGIDPLFLKLVTAIFVLLIVSLPKVGMGLKINK